MGYGFISILVVSCFMWIGALDLQLSRPSAIFHIITSIAYNHHTYLYLYTAGILFPIE